MLQIKKKRPYGIIRGIIILLVIPLFNCHHFKKNSISAVELISRIDVVNSPDGNLIKMTDSLVVFYHDSIFVYRIMNHHHYFEEEKNRVSLSDTVTFNAVGEETRYQYIICRRGDKWGIKFDSALSITGNRINMDSLFSKKAIFSFTKYYDEKNDSLIRTLTQKDTTREWYIPKIKFDDSYNDTSIFSFVKDFDSSVSFSFSNKLDDLKKMKLVKVLFIYNEISLKPPAPSIPRRQYQFEMRTVPAFNEKNILTLIDRFKQNRSFQ